MTPMPASSAATHVLRCVHCGKVQETADRMFRCTQSSELLEVVYPDCGGLAESNRTQVAGDFNTVGVSRLHGGG